MQPFFDFNDIFFTNHQAGSKAVGQVVDKLQFLHLALQFVCNLAHYHAQRKRVHLAPWLMHIAKDFRRLRELFGGE